MANLIVKTVDNEQKFALEQTLNQDIVNDSHVIIDFDTENTFIDKDIHVDLTVPAAAEPTLNIFDITTSMDMGQPENGIYSPEATISGNANIASPGWIASGNRAVAEAGVKIGKINQSLMSNGSTQLASGTTINPSDSEQTITISEGYNTARTLVIGAADSSAPGEITSGSATITDVNYLYNSTNDNFAVSGSATVSEPTIINAGYISTTKGIKNSNENGAVLSSTVNKIVLDSSLTGATTARKPTINKQAITTNGVTDAASGNATATAPSSGVYVAVRSAANTATITATPTVKTAGYGDTTNFGVDTNATATVGAAQSDIYYVPIVTITPNKNGRTISFGDGGWVMGGSISIDPGTVTSGAGTATISAPIWNNVSSKFIQRAYGQIAAPTVNTAGYISSTEGTKNGNNISGAGELDTVTVGVNISGTAKVTPAIKRTAKPTSDTWVDAASGVVTTSKPTSGAYVRVDADAVTSTLTITGKVSDKGYGTTGHYNTDTATSQSVGSNAATSTYVPIKTGTVTSGTANITTTSVAYNTTNNNFDITGTADVSAPTITTEGYIATTVGTVSGNVGGASLTSTLPKIGITAGLSANASTNITPTMAFSQDTNINIGNLTTRQPPSSYFYIGIQATLPPPIMVTGTANVTRTGYGTTTSGEYITANDTLTIDMNNVVRYATIASASFANSATSGTTYNDISSTAPTLISNDYLYINEGYTSNVKISLAKLIPDNATITTSTGANYILSGQSAYDGEGNLIVGSITTYNGSYTIT